MNTSQLKLIALYLPQYHVIPENNQWWGNGFTDWDKVKTSIPQFTDHNQPRYPLNGHYYDQSKIETLYNQAQLAIKYGIFGFCHYHYWFDGKQLIETPTNLMLENKDLNLPFCLSWANESWVKRWDGNHHKILIKQTHPPIKERWKLHFDYLIKAWSDERAIKVDGKPIFIIYRPQYIQNIEFMVEYWQKKAIEHGLKGIYLIAQKQYDLPSPEYLKSFDAVFQFQPFESIYSLGYHMHSRNSNNLIGIARLFPEFLQELLRTIHTKFVNKPTYFDYDEIWENIVRSSQTDSNLATFPGAFVDWDNTARYGKRATIFRGGSPERFKYWLSKLAESMSARKLPDNLIFINAWNEWAESAYLEPDTVNQYKYLEAISDIVSQS